LIHFYKRLSQGRLQGPRPSSTISEKNELKIVKIYAIEYRRRDLAEEDKKVKDCSELFCAVN